MKSNPSGGNVFYSTSWENLKNWVDQLSSAARLIGPQWVESVILYRQVSSNREIAWVDKRPLLSPKDAFFPPTEQLFTIHQEGSNLHIVETEPTGEQILFGIRPCDAHGLQALDALFIKSDPSDIYYQRRRKATTIIGMACSEMTPSCFCTSVSGAPDDSRYVDLMLYNGDGNYSLAVINEKGADLLARFPLTLNPIDPEIAHELYNPPISTGSSIHIPTLDDWPEHFRSTIWDEMSERCIGCRICAYVCPTCRCFDVRDQPLPSDKEGMLYERIRCWDSCTGNAYRRIAGGHNPRPDIGQRLRNRFYCKYYYYPTQYGPVACTGCGRCIDTCPVGVDIIEALTYVAQPT